MFEKIPGLKVLNFFDLKIESHKVLSKIKLVNKKYLLKSFSKLLKEEDFAQIYMGWNEKGLLFHADVKYPFSFSFFPEFRRGDSIEFFIDTRVLKTQGYITKYCHHFVFFPQDVQGTKGKEVTRFREDDMHKLCSDKDLIVISDIKPKNYSLSIEIPSHCLVGYDPLNINYLAFTYRINRYNHYPQHFSITSEEHVIEKSPDLWAKMILN